MDTRETDARGRLALLAEAPDTDAVRRIYDDWAPTYDLHDVAGLLGYPSPARVAERVADLVPPRADVLDVACGTGLVGAELAPRGFVSVDGLDLSPGMVRVARRRRVYHDLGPADLRHGVPGASGKFGVVTCVGAFAPGHLGPPALTGFLRVLRTDGFVVAAIAEDTWAAGEFAAAVDRLVEGGFAEPVDGPGGSVGDGPGRLLVLRAREVPGPGRSVAWRS
ncbi:class I SAM-dependent DNA methyltransferase [Actinomycetospora cinnamomea]|uniref:Methyltransferase family protein n=1 Tax=Actinomycetospora cinnamomea TaxID=663609 RepID=A0A2U1FIB7_9PSEU|nr:class I SAM-dependent methyltransferase [Actinomycetospora cinnamomea]PVZ11907.1 methyltransferase family protein [Actinomycetospora cinnamomea]